MFNKQINNIITWLKTILLSQNVDHKASAWASVTFIDVIPICAPENYVLQSKSFIETWWYWHLSHCCWGHILICLTVNISISIQIRIGI